MRWLLLLAALFAVGAPARARAQAKPTVAVLYFDYAGKDEDMGQLRKGLAQMLISDLAGLEQIQLVERDRLEEILAELKLGQSGKIDPASAAKVGKLLGARTMVLGGYFDLKGALRVDARVVDVQSGRVLASVGVNGKPDDFLGVEQKLAAELAAALGKELKSKAELVPAPRVKPPVKLSTKVAVMYSKGLGQLDRGEKDKARETLKEVVKEQADFKLAAVDLDKLMQ